MLSTHRYRTTNSTFYVNRNNETFMRLPNFEDPLRMYGDMDGEVTNCISLGIETDDMGQQRLHWITEDHVPGMSGIIIP